MSCSGWQEASRDVKPIAPERPGTFVIVGGSRVKVNDIRSYWSGITAKHVLEKAERRDFISQPGTGWRKFEIGMHIVGGLLNAYSGMPSMPEEPPKIKEIKREYLCVATYSSDDYYEYSNPRKLEELLDDMLGTIN